MPKASAATRRQAVFLILFIAACAAFLAWRLRPRDRVEDLLGYLPAGAAVRIYVDVPRTRGLLPLDSLQALGLTASGLDAAALALDEGEIYAAFSGVPSGMIESALANRGADCPKPIEEEACIVALSGVRLLVGVGRGGTTYASTRLTEGPSRSSAADAAAARQALEAGALAWAEAAPAKLLEESPKRLGGWSNVRLVARALEATRETYLTIEESQYGYALRLTAHCAPEQAEETLRVLGGLNRMGLALMEAQGGGTQPWSSVLRSFEASTHDDTIEAVWTFSAAELESLLGQLL